MTVTQAAKTPMREYQLRLAGHRRQQREEWERTRWHAWTEVQIAPFIKQQSKPKTPIDLLPLDGEKTSRDSITPDMCHISDFERERLEQIMTKFIEKKNKK